MVQRTTEVTHGNYSANSGEPSITNYFKLFSRDGGLLHQE
jgi:hypothetical protein